MQITLRGQTVKSKKISFSVKYQTQPPHFEQKKLFSYFFGKSTHHGGVFNVWFPFAVEQKNKRMKFIRETVLSVEYLTDREIPYCESSVP